jgi:hypothetical protein
LENHQFILNKRHQDYIREKTAIKESKVGIRAFAIHRVLGDKKGRKQKENSSSTPSLIPRPSTCHSFFLASWGHQSFVSGNIVFPKCPT